MTLAAPVPAWMFETCQVVGGKLSLPLSHCVFASSASAGASRCTGFFARCGYATWPCMPRTVELARERAAPAVLQHVAERSRPRSARRRCSSRSSSLRRLQLLDHPHRAVERRAFLVGGEQQGDRARMLRVAPSRTLRPRRRTRRSRTSCRPRRGRRACRRGWSARTDRSATRASGPVGTTSVWPAKHTSGLCVAAPRPEVGDLAELHRLALEPGARERAWR